MLKTKLSKIGITLAFLALYPLKAAASSFTDFVFLGDSITDSGNVFFATGETETPPFERTVARRPYNDTLNFSNGLVWAQYLANFNGLNANPSLIGGTNFAFGGATSQSLDEVLSPSLEEQLGFWQSATGNNADPNAFYFVQGGGNDIRELAQGRVSANTPEEFLQDSANAVKGVVRELIDAGATNIAVLNAPDLGLTPEAIASDFSPQVTALSQFYNNSVEQALGSLDTKDINLIEVDLFGFIRSITDDPTAFGLPASTVTDVPCVLPNSVCSNPDRFVFYDAIHPTTASHLALANVVNQQINDSVAPVPEPSTLILGLGCTLVLAKKRKYIK